MRKAFVALIVAVISALSCLGMAAHTGAVELTTAPVALPPYDSHAVSCLADTATERGPPTDDGAAATESAVDHLSHGHAACPASLTVRSATTEDHPDRLVQGALATGTTREQVRDRDVALSAFAPGGVAAEAGIPAESQAVLRGIQRDGVISEQGASGPSIPGVFRNDGGTGGSILPRLDDSGNPVTYRKWGTVPGAGNPKPGGERIVTGSDGSFWYSPDHYQTFIRWRP